MNHTKHFEMDRASEALVNIAEVNSNINFLKYFPLDRLILTWETLSNWKLVSINFLDLPAAPNAEGEPEGLMLSETVIAFSYIPVRDLKNLAIHIKPDEPPTEAEFEGPTTEQFTRWVEANGLDDDGGYSISRLVTTSSIVFFVHPSY